MKTLATLLVVTATTFSAADANAADPHLRELADALVAQSSHAVREVKYHFRRAPGGDRMLRTSIEIAELADHIADISRGRVELDHLREDVSQLDGLIHELEELAEATANTGTRHRGYGYGFHRRVSSYHLRRLARLIEEMEDTLHHLGEDLEDITGVVPVPRPVPRVVPGNRRGPILSPPVPVPPQPPRNRGTGFQIRRDNGRVVFSLRLR